MMYKAKPFLYLFSDIICSLRVKRINVETRIDVYDADTSHYVVGG